MSGAFLNLIGAGGGASAVTITLSTQFFYALNTGAPASAAFRLNTNGNAEYSENGGAYSVQEAWCVPAAQAVNYECYASLVTGTATGTFDTWLALTASRTWTVTQATIGVTDTIINVGIRRVGNATILASADISLSAERF
jgi:hypothetical protein